MHISRSTFGIVVLALMFVLSAPLAQCVPPTLTLAEQEVIEALLSQADLTRVSKKYVIEDTTSVRKLQEGKDYDSFSEDLRQEAEHRDKPFRQALNDFLKKNKASVQIVFPTNAPKSVKLVSAAAIKEIFSAKPDAKPNGWDTFYQRFPEAGGLIRISRVGIDSKRSVAVIYLGEQSGYLAGSGQIYVLRWEGGKWVLKKDESIGPDWD